MKPPSQIEVDESVQIQAKEAMQFLRTREMAIATPCYGGQMTVNYTNSLIGLINLCHDIGIKYSTDFYYNESLIPRARNAMVHNFKKNHPTATDFIFIDADIGFNPKDILTLLLHTQEEVIGAPCVRKSLNWGRIVDAVKKNGQVFTPEELMKLGGEFVINFPPDQTPEEFDLGKLIEVQDVGTGIMRIKREVFSKIEDAFSDRWYLPMHGEGIIEPMYMFFQSGIDPQSAKFNPGNLPFYVSEDYAFCRLCRDAGIKIWIAPYMISSHAGFTIYHGDLLTVAKAGGGVRN